MGKIRRNPQRNVHTKEPCRKDSCSEIKEFMHSNAHTLREKYKNILGCRQPIIMLERYSISKNISHPNCLQVSPKISVNNTCDTNDTRTLVHSTNHVSHQSQCVEKTDLASVRQSSEFSSTTNVSKNVSQISRVHSKRDTSSEHKSITKIDKSDSTSSLDEIMGEVDTKHEVDVKREALQNGRSLKICLERIVLYDNNSNVINVAHNPGHLQKNNLNESVAKPQKCNKNIAADDAVKPCKRMKIYISTDSTSTEEDTADISKADFPINGTLINDNRNEEVFSSSENLELMSLQETLATKESTKSEDNTSSLCIGNSRSSTLILQTPEKLKEVKLQEKLIELQEKLNAPSSNKLSKHTKKHTVACTQKSTIMEDTKDKLSTSNRTFINSSTDTVQYSEGFIVPGSNELSKHTRKRSLAHTRTSTTMKDTEDTLSASNRNFTNSFTSAVQSSGTLVMSHSNDSNKQTKESTVVNIERNIKVKEKISEDNNVEHDASHHQHEQRSLRSQKCVKDVKKIKLNRTTWHRRLEAENKAVDTSKEVDRTEKIVELKNHVNIPQLIHTDVPGPSIEFPEEDNITYGVQVAQAKNEERGVSSIEKQTSIETFGYSNRLECNAQKDARKSQQNAATENHIPVSENTFSFSENFNNSALQGDEDDCISLYADSMLIEEYDIPETPQSRRSKEAPRSRRSRRSKEAPLVTDRQYVMTDKVIDNYYKKNALEFNEAYNVDYSNNSKTQIVPQREKPVEIVLQREKPVEIVLQREKPIKIVPQREKPVEIVPQREKPVEIVPQREKPVEIVPQRKKPVEIVPQRKKPIKIVPQREKPIKIVLQREKPVEIVSETKKPAKIIPLMKAKVQPVRKHITARLTLNPQTQTQTNTRTVNQSNQNGLFSVFRGFCYRMIRTGVCYGNTCNYAHNFAPFLILMYNRNETGFFEVMDDLIQQQHIIFLKSFYKQCIRTDTNFVCILKLLKKFYTSNVISSQIVYDSIKELIMWGITVNQIVDILATIVDASDTQFDIIISKILVNYIKSGDGWSTLKPLLMRIDKLDEDIIQLILVECILTQKHVQDVYENVVLKLDNESLGLFNKRLLLQFHNIHRPIQENVKVAEEMASTSVTIASPSSLNEPEIIPYTAQTDNLSPKVWKNVSFDSNNNMQGENSLALLHPIDNVPSPYSEQSRERFWKFYLDVHSLQEGLKHNDYRHVKKILDEAQGRHLSPFTNACYNILRRNVEHSQSHLSKLASLAVQDGATATFFKILIDVTIHILADMAERELWVLGLLLLNSMEGILHEQSSFLKFDAVVNMLFCEIYLANRKPMKAFNLLKQCNILYTYRGKWKVRNNEKDDDIRTQVMTILLDMFCDMSPEYAFSLFKFLIVDQSSNFYPIDLLYQANKLVSSLLLRNDHELIIDIGKLIDDYNCTLHPITYRALISSLVRINLPLAKQVYQSAVLLGIYPEMQLYPIMYIIVQSDWTGEEMYLAIWAMMHKLLENLGHAIEGVKQRNLSSYLVFEATPSGKQLVNDTGTNEQYKNKLIGSLNLMRNVLRKEFHPPLFLVKKRKGKLQKISCMSLYKYLKRNQMNCPQYI